MSFVKFLFGMGKQKTKEMGETITSAIVSFDPESASEVQIEEMNSRFIKLSEKVEIARQDYEKEQREADQIQATYDKKKQAALILQEDLKTKPEVENSFNKLVAELEEMKPDLETEKEEAVEAKIWLDTLEKDLEMLSVKLKTARKNLEKASKNMEKAKHKVEKAKERASEAEQRAGIRKTTDALDSVLNVMNDEVAKAEASANAADRRSKLLETKSIEEDLHVADALRRVNGDDKPKSASDRLASL